MYGSIRKSYGAKKASHENERRETKSFFGKTKAKSAGVKDVIFQETSYMNVEVSKKQQSARPNKVLRPNQENNSGSAKSEFPIASVILTIVFTMMVMVLAFGLGGV